MLVECWTFMQPMAVVNRFHGDFMQIPSRLFFIQLTPVMHNWTQLSNLVSWISDVHSNLFHSDKPFHPKHLVSPFRTSPRLSATAITSNQHEYKFFCQITLVRGNSSCFLYHPRSDRKNFIHHLTRYQQRYFDCQLYEFLTKKVTSSFLISIRSAMWSIYL